MLVLVLASEVAAAGEVGFGMQISPSDAGRAHLGLRRGPHWGGIPEDAAGEASPTAPIDPSILYTGFCVYFAFILHLFAYHPCLALRCALAALAALRGLCARALRVVQHQLFAFAHALSRGGGTIVWRAESRAVLRGVRGEWLSL
jgi:hypothetical protein